MHRGGRSRPWGQREGNCREWEERSCCQNRELWGGPAAAADVARGGDVKRGMARTAGGEGASSSAPSAVLRGGESGSRSSAWGVGHHGQNAGE